MMLSSQAWGPCMACGCRRARSMPQRVWRTCGRSRTACPTGEGCWNSLHCKHPSSSAQRAVLHAGGWCRLTPAQLLCGSGAALCGPLATSMTRRLSRRCVSSFPIGHAPMASCRALLHAAMSCHHDAHLQVSGSKEGVLLKLYSLCVHRFTSCSPSITWRMTTRCSGV